MQVVFCHRSRRACDDSVARACREQPGLLMLQRAKDALANNNYVRLADGQIVPQSGYDYGTHFSLGDISELRASSGLPSLARVSEFIRTQDGTGYKAYPTLSVISE